jgi:hypothetical protein
MPDETAIDLAVGQSVQSPHDDYYIGSLTDYSWAGEYGTSLPSIYHPYRQALLTRIATHPQASMWMGAASGLIKRISSTSWEVKGKRRVNYFQDILLDAEFGTGWETLLQKLLWDFLTSDDGAFLQIIGRGDAATPLKREMVTGLSALASAYCYPTGNPEWPVWYQDAVTGKLHRLHRTRVVRFVDQPMPDPLLRGRGICALSRAMTYVQQAIVTATYNGQALDNTPPPGIAIWNGAQQVAVKKMWDVYNINLRAGSLGLGGQTRYLPNAEYINPANESKAELTYHNFAVAPVGFDAEKYERIQAAGIARALGVDVQDVLALQGGTFGTGTQSVVLEKKASGKMEAAIYKMLERGINVKALPDPIRFTFKPRDTEKQKADADITTVHLGNAQALAALPGVMPDAALRYLANNDQAMADVLLDGNGQLRMAYDDDPAEEIPEGQRAPVIEMVNTDSTRDTETDAPIIEDDDQAISAAALKMFEEEVAGFRDRFAQVIFSINDGGLDSSRRADSIIRSIVRNEGMAMMLAGMKDGGLPVDRLNKKDLRIYTEWWKETSKYITNLVSRLWGFGDGKLDRSEAAVRQTIDLWAGKSMRDAYMRGLAIADKDGMYEWSLGQTEKHCPDCKALNGQVHRLSEYVEAGAVPGSSRLACWGGNCDCRLKKTRKAARGTIVMAGRRSHHQHPHTTAVAA